METNQIPFVPADPASTTTTSSTTTTTACTATIVTNAMTLNAYKGDPIGIPAFSFYVSSANRNKVRATGFRIKDLPLIADGALYINNVAVVDEQLIAVADNGKLVYSPKSNADSQATFNFLVETTCGLGSQTTVTINVTDKPVDDDCNCGSTTTSSTSTTTL